MNSEFEARKLAFSRRDSIWEEYGRIRDRNNVIIESLKREADAEHFAMQDCFERASNAYQYGDKSEASFYSQEGHAHRNRRNDLNAEISALIREVKQTKTNAEASAPKVDSSAFDRAKSAFEVAKCRHESAQAEFKKLKAMRDSAKAEFDSLHAQFKQAQTAFRQKLEEVRSERAIKQQQVVEKVNMALVQSSAHYLGSLFGQNAKIVPHSDGTTHIFFGGLNAAGDGIGHGHAVIDCDGNVTYLRDAWQDHDDYLIDNARKRGTNTHNI